MFFSSSLQADAPGPRAFRGSRAKWVLEAKRRFLQEPLQNILYNKDYSFGDRKYFLDLKAGARLELDRTWTGTCSPIKYTLSLHVGDEEKRSAPIEESFYDKLLARFDLEDERVIRMAVASIPSD